MTRDELAEHKEMYNNQQLSGGAFILLQECRIVFLEELLKAKDEEIDMWKKSFQELQNKAIELDMQIWRMKKDTEEDEDTPCA